MTQAEINILEIKAKRTAARAKDLRCAKKASPIRLDAVKRADEALKRYLAAVNRADDFQNSRAHYA